MLLLTGPYRIDTERKVIWQDENLVRLPPRAIGVLVCLVEQRGNLTLKEELRERVWPGTTVEENGIAQVVSLLRRELKAGFGDVEVIETIPRRGYRFMMEVVEVPDSTAAAELPRVAAPEVTEVQAEAVEAQPVVSPVNVRPRRVPHLAWAVGLLVAAAGIYGGARSLNRNTPPPRVYPLTDVTFDEQFPSISPDGKRVAYSRKLPGEAVYDLYVKEVGGPAPRKITSSEADSMWPAWSPDGETIAYTRRYPDHGEVRVVSPLGRGDGMLVRLNKSQHSTMAWTPDGKALVYSDNAYPGGGIFLFSMATTQQRRLTTIPDPSMNDRYPQISPDGKLLAFGRLTPGKNTEDVYVVPVGGGPERRVAQASNHLLGIIFSHDGEELIFTSALAGTKYLYRVPVAGGKTPEKVEVGPDAEHPSLAAGMDRLAFGVYYFSMFLWRNSVGVDDLKELALPGFRRLEPRFSPDGKRLAFVGNAAGFDEVWVANLDGSGAHRLTSGSVTSADGLAWSPDAQHIAFAKAEEQNRSALWVVPAAGGTARRLSQPDGEYYFPSWSVDGKWLYFSSTRTGPREIWRQAWPTGPMEQVTRTGGFKVQTSPDGKYLYFSRHGSARLFRMPVGGGDAEIVREIPELTTRSLWRVTRGGYYWFHWKPGTDVTILFYDFATGKTRPAIPAKTHYSNYWQTFDVAPDDSSIIWPQWEPPVRRIMIADGFR